LLYVGHTRRVAIFWVTPLGSKQQLDGPISWKKCVLFLLFLFNTNSDWVSFSCKILYDMLSSCPLFIMYVGI